MPGYKKPKTKAIRPTIILKIRDVEALRRWQTWAGVPISIVSVFPDSYAMGIRLGEAFRLIAGGTIKDEEYAYGQDKKETTTVWKIPFTLCPIGFTAVSRGKLMAGVSVTQKNGKITYDYYVDGGKIEAGPDAVAMLTSGYEAEETEVATFWQTTLAPVVTAIEAGLAKAIGKAEAKAQKAAEEAIVKAQKAAARAATKQRQADERAAIDARKAERLRIREAKAAKG